MPRPLALIVVAVLVMLAAPREVTAASEVDLQLVLAVDASGSVDNDRFELQKRGYSAAFRNPRVVQAIRSSPSQAIAVTMTQWTGPTLHVQVVDWTRIADEASSLRFADAIDAAPRALFGGGTSISGAIDDAMLLLAKSPFQATRRIIDISGDGSNNRGRAFAASRDAAVRDGVAINGLPILTLEPDLESYYEANVIGGPGAFVVAAASYDDFATAILNKLVAEIAGTTPATRLRAVAKACDNHDCGSR
jgi:hypothetical protein